MALFKRAISNIKATYFLLATGGRNLSTGSSIKKSVFISQSKDIYANLAIQDWICKNIDMTDHHIMMLWQNEPCVTIGKSQNPWCEANVSDLPKITECGVKLARQKSEAPSLYHDQGNLNVTFFTKKGSLKEDYDIEIISRAIFREFDMKLDMFGQLKMGTTYTVSGTTTKKDEVNAYHHCNLLVDVNKVDRSRSLAKKEIGVHQKHDTDLEKLKMVNLCEGNSNISVAKLVKAIGWEFMRTHASSLKDGGEYLANQQKGFQLINPIESWFPGIKKIREDLTRWEWLYGETPDFKVSRTLCKAATIGHYLDEGCCELNMELTVSSGIIKEATLAVPSRMPDSGFNGVINTVTTTLIGRKFAPELVENLQESIKNLGDDKLTQPFFPRQIMTSS